MANRTCTTVNCTRAASRNRDICRPCWKRSQRPSRRPAVDPLPGEVWKDIPGYEGRFLASSLGRLAKYEPEGRPPTLKKQTPTDLGYFKVRLSTADGVSTLFLAHRLIALTFHGECPASYEVRHLNGNPSDNRSENLRYGTSSENKYDTVRMGRHWQRRKTHCRNGHAFTEQNTQWVGAGRRRRCATCHRASHRSGSTETAN